MSTRALDGLLLLDKPAGCTSNAALQQAKRLFGAAKAGHAGTLDPLASGLLPVLFGEATKFASFLLDADKAYHAGIRLGIATSTGDAEGEVIERRPVSASDTDLERVLAAFRGPIVQTPPMYSALKHQGRALYELAREGVTVERKPRAAHIRRLELERRAGDFVEIRVRCSKGTYVRTLAEDIGRALGSCAHLETLRRTETAGFGVDAAIGLAGIEAIDPDRRHALLRPVDSLLEGLPRVELASGADERIRQGQAVRQEGLAAGRCALYCAGILLGVGEGDGCGGVRPVRLIAAARAGAQPADLHRKTL